MIIFCSRLAHGGVFRQHDDAGMVGTHAYLVFSAYHSVGVYAAQARLLDGEFLVAVVEHAAQVGHDDLLPGRYVGRAAHYLLRLGLA